MEKRKKIVIRSKSKDSQKKEIKKDPPPQLKQEEKPIEPVEEAIPAEESSDKGEPLPPLPSSSNKYVRRGLILGGLAVIIALVTWLVWPSSPKDESNAVTTEVDSNDCSEVLYDIPLCGYKITQSVIKANESFNSVLEANRLPRTKIEESRVGMRGTFELSSIGPGTIYSLITQRGSNKLPHYAIFQPKDIAEVLVLDFASEKEIGVRAISTEVKVEEKLISSLVNDHFWQLVIEKGGHIDVIEKLSDALKYSVKIQQLTYGDRFKFIYEQKVSGEKVIGSGDLKAIYFHADGKEHYIYYFGRAGAKGYYDKDGNGLKAGFLKSPVKIGRISSPFGMRFHPKDKVMKPHLGTDFAAPIGSPIYAAADGTILDAKFRGHNGNYVKIKHKPPYKTQYLHMSGFAKGIVPGAKVRQGQVIGFVGMTGKTTGPHVCYRFWKNDQQIDPKSVQTSSQGKKIPPAFRKEYYAFVKKYKAKLDEAKIY